jgi:hypothetical protein
LNGKEEEVDLILLVEDAFGLLSGIDRQLPKEFPN